MYTLLAQQVEEVRRRLDQPTSAKIPNNYIIRVLNDGAVRFARELYLSTDDIYAFTTANAQQRYPLPADFIDTSEVIWQYDVSHYPIARVDYKDIVQSLPQQGDPAYYAIDEAQKSIMFDPIPQSTAVTTTLSSGITATDSSINVSSTSGFGGIGYFSVDSEIIYYTAITATSFTGCIRGACNTVAAAHSGAAVCTWCDIVMYYTRLPKLYTRLNIKSRVTVTNGSTIVTGDGVVQWASGQNIYPGQYLGVGQMLGQIVSGQPAIPTNTSNENFPLVWYKIASINSTTQLTLASVYSETSTASAFTPDACIITDMCELYEQDCSVPIAWATYVCEGILGNKEKKETARLSFTAEMSLAKERRDGPDNLLVTRPTKFAQNVGSQIVRAPGHYEKFNF